MGEVLFEYREIENRQTDKKCKFKAFGSDGAYWEAIIELPYKYGNLFWEFPQEHEVVVEKSREIAKKYNAPSWVWREL